MGRCQDILPVAHGKAIPKTVKVKLISLDPHIQYINERIRVDFGGV
jgi:hypothetical protein